MKFKGWITLTGTLLVLAVTIILLRTYQNTVPAYETYKVYEIGETIQFGNYDWRVLAIDGGYALVLKETVITRQPYHHSQQTITWEESSSRNWLNNDFIDNFSSQEQTRIRETTIINNSNPWFGTNGGNNTTDRIFLLSIDEAIKYLGDSGMMTLGIDENERTANWPELGVHWWGIFDQYNTARVAYNASGWASWWWLRTPGLYADIAAIILTNGDLSVHGAAVNDSMAGGGLRPAMWISR